MSKWSYRGTDLETLGIVTLVSDSLKMPERRGENMLIPNREGRLFVEKEFEQRSMTLGLEVAKDSIAELEAAMDVVKTLFGKRTLGTLTQTLEDLSVRTCQAEYTGDLNLSRISPVSVRMALDFTMPDPFFRSTTLISDTQTINASPKNYTLNNPGSADERRATITLTGPLRNLVITNTKNTISLTYKGTIASGDVVTISEENGEYQAVHSVSGNVIGNVSHSGAAALMVLDAGDNAMSITDADHAGGTVKIEFYPPYL
jgi:phage-related protein